MRGGGGVFKTPKKDYVIYEQPLIYGQWGIAFIRQFVFKQYKKHLFRLERPPRILQPFISVKNYNNTATSFADHHSVVSKFLFKKIMQLCSTPPPSNLS